MVSFALAGVFNRNSPCRSRRSERQQEAFDRLAFEPEFAPFVDEAARFNDPATCGQPQVSAVPPDAADRDDGIEPTLIPKSEGCAELRRATETFPPTEQE